MHWQILNLDIICSIRKTALLYLFCFHSLKRKIIFSLAAQNKKETLILLIWTLQFESISFKYKPLVLFIYGIKSSGSPARSCCRLQGYLQEYLRLGCSVLQDVFLSKFLLFTKPGLKKEYHMSSSVFLAPRFLYKHKSIV